MVLRMRHVYENESQRTGFEDLGQYMGRIMNVSGAVMSAKGGEKSLEIQKKHQAERHKKAELTKSHLPAVQLLEQK